MAILYSLPFDCPFPFPSSPPYKIIQSQQDQDLLSNLSSHYFQLVYSTTTTTTLRSFSTSLSSLPPTLQSISTLRQHLLPIHDFDHKWRNIIPSLLSPSDTHIESTTLLEGEAEAFLDAHKEWQNENEREKEKREGNDVDVEEMRNEGSMWMKRKEESRGDWLARLELVDTFIQSLLLLTISSLSLSLPPPPTTTTTTKRKKSSSFPDPQRSKETLDPILAFDFMTDRLQIWRMMNDFSVGESGAEGEKKVKKKDQVQEWWETCVEPLFVPLLPHPLSSQRAKLFPHEPILPSPAPSLSLPRSLLSLDLSARKKSSSLLSQAHHRKITESPTMRRLVGLVLEDQEDVFIVPEVSRGTSKKLFGARGREVSLGRRGKKEEMGVSLKKEKVKRKSSSPRKLSHSHPHLLVPDTPAKLPSFAALGAAFRPGSKKEEGLGWGKEGLEWDEEGLGWDEEGLGEGERGMGTPKMKKRELLVPDT